MNIVIDARDAQLSRVGVAVYCSNIIKEFERQSSNKHTFYYLTTTSMIQPEVSGHILPVAPGPDDSYLRKFIWYFNLPGFLKKLNADLYFGNFIPLPFQQKFPCPTVITAHDAASISTNELVGSGVARYRNKLFVSRWVKSVTHIICISKYCQWEFSKIFGASFLEKSSIIHHGLPSEFSDKILPTEDILSRLKTKYSHGQDYIISVGTVHPKKNYERLVEAFSKLENKDIHLIICGGVGYGAEAITSSPDKFAITNRVHFLSGLSTEVIHNLLCGARCFVFPSLYEGFGIPLLEAFHVGIPVASSNATCLPEIAADAAHYFNPYSVDEIAKSITYVLNNKKLQTELVASGHKRLEDFTWRKSAQEHISLFENLMK